MNEKPLTAGSESLLPLVVDLDGTLIRTDMLLESAMGFVRDNPMQSLLPILWLTEGKAVLKSKLANNNFSDVAVLPYNDMVINLIREAKAQGRKVVLATATHASIAEKIGSHLGFFDEIFATDKTNLSARNKRDRLVSEFGLHGFDYIGNSTDDLIVWEAASKAFVVDPTLMLKNRLHEIKNLSNVFVTKSNDLKVWAKGLRLHQWMKNLLIFVPLVAAHQVFDLNQLTIGLLAFLFFGFCASSVYLLNDLLDLQDDRHHYAKRNRPLAAGRMPITGAVLAMLTMLFVAFYGSMILLPMNFVFVLLFYYVLTLAYSLVLKRWMGVDVVTLALLYTLRIIAGGAAFELTLTFWMLAFAIFIFFSLALVKRYVELQEARESGRKEKSRGRGYYPGDLEMISSLGGASGYISVLVFALYINDLPNSSLYAHPQIAWVAVPLLLFWITRTWLLAHRGEMHDDPVVFALKDKISFVVGILMLCVFVMAL